ncbi:hypothetical protein OU415_27455 [Saccharopolyspora sp. WRP15-2]|uniref:Uncharacterized protein n=1 Tax=Saccharopolyspora oryzae TaxID=2997343 RepID=A0ABT4V5F3_9PSEU|nr:hypothetical protein [Saccharopolyspora oryzae]MDA3629195.1 hypothetical protein [Saccharopolyspora oryzae]
MTYQYNAPGIVQHSPEQACEQEDLGFCEGSVLDDGSVLLHQVRQPDGDPFTSATSTHYMLDGSVTMITAYNYDPILDDQKDPKSRPEVAVPFEQLDVLALDPELALR